MKHHDIKIYDWDEWDAICLSHRLDPWAISEIVIDYTHDDYRLAIYGGARPARPTDRNDAPAILSIECVYCHRVDWVADMLELGDGNHAHPVCHQAVIEAMREIRK